jgi:hypothetical protein
MRRLAAEDFQDKETAMGNRNEIVAGLESLAKQLPPDYDGGLSIHTETIIDRDQLARFARLLSNQRVMHSGETLSWVTGDLGAVRVMLTYKRGLLGEPDARPKPSTNEQASLENLNELICQSA